MQPVHSYIVSAKLPDKISKLKELAYNYWWCWNYHGKELFSRVNPVIWEEVNHNPVLLLNKLRQEQLQELSAQSDFTSFVDYVHSKFVKYMESDAWYNGINGTNHGRIAYFSTEYGINESFPNYSGGLGVLSGDHLKSSSDLGLPLMGIGLLYQQGYFRQRMTQNGWQNEYYHYNDFHSMPLILMRDGAGLPLVVDVDLPKGKAYIQIWKLQIGKIPLYLLDTNFELNKLDEYRDITDQLYGGTRETRIQQEIVLGIGGMRALNAMNIEPEVFHINEGHAAFALIERTRYLMQKFNFDFSSAKQIVKSTSIFTTHTPVPAGNEVFKPDMMDVYFNNYIKTLGITKEEFMVYGQIGSYNPSNEFSMTILGLKMTSFQNGVSKLHGVVARKMWHSLWDQFPEDEVPIISITNGVHTLTWVAREFAELYDRYLTPRWKTDTDNQDIWDSIDLIPSEEIWREKQRRRVRLVLFARKYLQQRQKSFLTPEQVSKINQYLDPDALTIGFARRFATYKRATLIFRDMERLSAILKNSEKPVQMIIAGKAHPHDTMGKEVIQSIIQRVKNYGLDKHVVFLEDYDLVVARLMVKGCDIWLNTPVRPMEASGTSGMKAALNGTVNLSILDGWWDEGFTGDNGFAIGHGEEYENSEEQEIIESGELYELLEQAIVPAFYERTDFGKLSEKWVTYMKNSIKSNAGRFSTTRMLKEYSNYFYIPALKNFNDFTSNNAENALLLKQWKDKIRSEWRFVEILNVSMLEEDEYFVGKPIRISTKIKMRNLSPEDIAVQVYYGTVNPHGEMTETHFQTLELIRNENNEFDFEGIYLCPDTGQQGFTIRVIPTHKLLVNSSEMFLCTWARI